MGRRQHERAGRPIVAGVSTAFIGYTSTFSVVLAGLQAVGASSAEAASGLVALCAVLGVGSLWLSRRTRMPITLAWSTPGAAVLASAGHIAGGWPAAIGGFVLAGLLVALTGLWPRLGVLVSAIPAPISQAMLAGILMELCLVPVRAAASFPWQVIPILLVWLVMQIVAQRWAIPAAFGTLLVVVLWSAYLGEGVHGSWVPSLVWTTPSISWEAVVSIALPLYVVTMAAQNVPGIAIMSSYDFAVPWTGPMCLTGLGSVVAAPFGGHAVNLAAISAALPASEESHPDPAQRWRASQAFGVTYLGIAVATTALISFLSSAPGEVVGTVAGLALLSTLVSALGNALDRKQSPYQLTAAVATFLVAASSTTFLNISSAFWSLLVGLVIWFSGSTSTKSTGKTS